MSTSRKKVQLDEDVAEWLRDTLFPPPDSGRPGAQVTGVPGDPEFDKAVDLFTRAKTQLGGE